jgi:TetR/AcrR family transcriptional repressor of nem operon
MEPGDTKTKLLDVAGALVQTRGYHGFSFHDLARNVDITTASIHYHFPTKGALGQALVKRYTLLFLNVLGKPDAAPPVQCLTHYVGVFRESLLEGRMCLCGMIGAEVDGVPAEVALEVRQFFAANLNWLTSAFQAGGESPVAAEAKARLFLSTLEGAMLIARASGDPGSFDEVAKTVLSLCSSPVQGRSSKKGTTRERRNSSKKTRSK